MRIGDIQLNQNKILRISKDTVNMVTFYQIINIPEEQL